MYTASEIDCLSRLLTVRNFVNCVFSDNGFFITVIFDSAKLLKITETLKFFMLKIYKNPLLFVEPTILVFYNRDKACQLKHKNFRKQRKNSCLLFIVYLLSY